MNNRFKLNIPERFDLLVSLLNNKGVQAEAVKSAHNLEGWRGELQLFSFQGSRFLTVVKHSPGRADRLLPILSQAVLQASTIATKRADNDRPLALLVVDQSTKALFASVKDFAEKFVPDVAVGVVSLDGSCFFRGMGLDGLTSMPKFSRGVTTPSSATSVNLFSDLNQWLLKVLLAPLLPEKLLTAPRNKYRSGRQLADAAGASHMSATRFLQQLKAEGYLDERAEFITLIRHQEIFMRWRAATNIPKKEMPVRFLFSGVADSMLRKLLHEEPNETCLGLFAAADELNFGHVSGVVPYLYVPKLAPIVFGQGLWRAVTFVAPGVRPDFYLRQAPAPISTFRGAVRSDGISCSDVIQVWLDVSHHPSRGREQADLIYGKYLQPLFQIP